MKLSQLLNGITTVEHYSDIDVTGITHDSRQVKSGDLFCAIPGLKVHGGEYIVDIIPQQPAAILLDANFILSDTLIAALLANDIRVVCVTDIIAKLGMIAARFFHDPSQHMHLVAVTGTNGKTSVCHFLAEAMHVCAHKCGVLGTAGIGFINQLSTSALTTPDAIALQHCLAEFLAEGAEMVALEASSHALIQQRLAGCQIETAVFTNLSPEHLDYHADMDDYASAKERLMQWPGLRQAVVNVDDPIGLQWCQRYHEKYPVIAYSCAEILPTLPNGVNLLHGTLNASSTEGLHAQITSPWGNADIQVPIIGKFNLANLLAVLGVMHFYHDNFSECINAIQQVHGVCGRMQLFTQAVGPSVVVDFAHTSDALANALSSLRAHVSGQLWCVFGCGGSRDKEKRPLMGQIAAEFADHIILTNDNPRQDKPSDIIADIQQGIPASHHSVQVEMDRAAAIEYAISRAGLDDIILIAGKGHETYQLIGDQRLSFSDQAVVKQCLQLN